MDSRGGNRMPSALETTYRVQRHIVTKICGDEEFDAFDLKESLKIEPLLQESIENLKFEIPRNIKISEEEGVIYTSGFIARKMKKIDPSLGSYKHDPSPDQMSSKFLDLFSRGGLTFPGQTWHSNVKKMREMFLLHHPTNSLQSGRGVITNFFLRLVKEFPPYDKRILHLVARMFTRFRLRWMNKLKKQKKRGKGKKSNMTLRGKKNLAQLSS